MLTNETYDKLVIFDEIVLGFAAAFLILYGETFGIPYAETVGGFIAAVAGLLGTYLTKARALYKSLQIPDEDTLSEEDGDEPIEEGDDDGEEE